MVSFDDFQIHVSKKWGFTKWEKPDYEVMRADGRLIPDGVNVQYKPNKGPLQAWMDRQRV
jgi:large subunit ribosomal protein L10e